MWFEMQTLFLPKFHSQLNPIEHVGGRPRLTPGISATRVRHLFPDAICNRTPDLGREAIVSLDYWPMCWAEEWNSVHSSSLGKATSFQCNFNKYPFGNIWNWMEVMSFQTVARTLQGAKFYPLLLHNYLKVFCSHARFWAGFPCDGRARPLLFHLFDTLLACKYMRTVWGLMYFSVQVVSGARG